MAIDINAARRVTAHKVEEGSELSSERSEKRRKPIELFGSSAKKIGHRERMFFTERLSLLLDTGVPLHSALESIASQSTHGEMAALTRSLRDDVTGGASFGRALSNHPEVFPVTYINLIGAAEVGGFLPVALERLRDMEERREELRATMSSALSYPMILAFFSVAVIIFVLVVVFPKFEDMFSMIHDQLPITTRWLMATSEVLRRWWVLILIGIAAMGKLGSDWLKRPNGVDTLDRWILAIPGLRTTVIQLNVVQILRVMGLSLGNGVSVVEALGSAQESVTSAKFRRFLKSVEIGVNEGRGLAYGFKQEPMIPELVQQMIETGEESGNLPGVMARLADFYEREWRRALGAIAKITEPAMLIIMGGVVGLIVSSLILPIFKLSRAVH